jgi:hypothetical protein
MNVIGQKGCCSEVKEIATAPPHGTFKTVVVEFDVTMQYTTFMESLHGNKHGAHKHEDLLAFLFAGDECG